MPDRDSSQPGHSGCEQDEAGEVDGSAVVAGGEAAEVLEAVEAAPDAVSVAAEGRVMGNGHLPAAACRDDGQRAHVRGLVAQGVAVMGFVRRHGPDVLPIRQPGRCRDVIGLTGVMTKRSGLPKASASMWILVVSPPRDRPDA